MLFVFISKLFIFMCHSICFANTWVLVAGRENYFLMIYCAVFLGLTFHFSFIGGLNVSSTWIHYPFTFIIYVLIYGEVWNMKVDLSKEGEQGLQEGTYRL